MLWEFIKICIFTVVLLTVLSALVLLIGYLWQFSIGKAIISILAIAIVIIGGLAAMSDNANPL